MDLLSYQDMDYSDAIADARSDHPRIGYASLPPDVQDALLASWVGTQPGYEAMNDLTELQVQEVFNAISKVVATRRAGDADMVASCVELGQLLCNVLVPAVESRVEDDFNDAADDDEVDMYEEARRDYERGVMRELRALEGRRWRAWEA